MAFNQMPSADREAESLPKILPATAECLNNSKIMLAQPIILAILLLQLPTPSHSLAPLPSVRVGAQFPIFKTKANKYAEDAGGRRRQAAFLLGIQHINNKNDGFFDDVLPSTTLDIALYDSKRDEGVAVVNAFRIWDDFDAAVAVGPASSGPSKSAQQVLKVLWHLKNLDIHFKSTIGVHSKSLRSLFVYPSLHSLEICGELFLLVQYTTSTFGSTKLLFSKN